MSEFKEQLRIAEMDRIFGVGPENCRLMVYAQWYAVCLGIQIVKGGVSLFVGPFSMSIVNLKKYAPSTRK